MATYTENLNLEMPTQEEYYNVDVQNANMQKIDSSIYQTSSEATGHYSNQIVHTTLDEKNSFSSLETRVKRLEDGLYNDITKNPFMIRFENLDGITIVKGNWNEALQRIEC